jgi:hypothetical protein
VRRPKKRPRSGRGTSSLIHATHALLPTTPSTAEPTAIATSRRCCPASVSGSHGTRHSGSISSRDRHTAVSATRRCPSVDVSHAAGNCTNWAKKEMEVITPTRKGPSFSAMAHAVSTVAPAHAVNTSANMPSTTEVLSDRRSPECSRAGGAGASSGKGPLSSGALAPGTEPPGRNSGMAVARVERLRSNGRREAVGDTRSRGERGGLSLSHAPPEDSIGLRRAAAGRPEGNRASVLLHRLAGSPTQAPLIPRITSQGHPVKTPQVSLCCSRGLELYERTRR